MSLPLVLDVTGRRVVCVGGGPVTSRRVRAFLDEGAVVEVVAPEVDSPLRELAATGALTWTRRGYGGPADLVGAWLVHTATGVPEVDAAVAEDSRAAHVWCIDATNAARTAAAVPARAELATPDGPVGVATFASGDPLRATRVRDGILRLAGEGRLDLRLGRQRTGAGWVALVGGGPGDDGLLTARGAQLLAAADVVVVDRLAPQGVLKRLADGVRVIDVGKAPGRHPVPQHEINDLLVDEAGRGHGVVRLKGGDPFVFGRGGEERQHCLVHGVRVEVVPGVTSAVSVPAAAGIPVTHRGVARAFTVVTSHEDVPDLPTSGGHTLVLLMGVATLPRTVDLLLAAGRSPQTPVAIVERGFDPTQRTTFATLSTVTDHLDGVEAPAVVVVGDVVRLSPDYPDHA